MTILHISFAKRTYKSLTRRKTKKMYFYVEDFVTGKKSKEALIVKMSSCCTNIRSCSFSVSRCYCYRKLVRRIKEQQKTCLKSSVKKTCRIIITTFLLSFSIYLVSLSLYTKFVHKVLFKRHLIFVVNINTVFLLLHIIEAPLYLNLQQLGKLDFKPKLVL